LFSFHRQLIAFTLCGAPDAPPTVEILKVVSNGLLLSWLPPKRDNGMQILLYEVEIIDFGELQRQGMDAESLAAGSLPVLKSRKSLKAGGASSAKDAFVSEDEEEDDNEGREAEEGPPEHGSEKAAAATSNSSSSSSSRHGAAGAAGAAGGASSSGRGTNGNSMWHRVITHHNVANRVKLIMGLEPNRLYCCRVRAYNDIGFGEWSRWNRPVAPHNGVSGIPEHEFVASSSSASSSSASAAARGGDRDGGDGLSAAAFMQRSNTLSSIALTWFEPVLALTRRVTAYEVRAHLRIDSSSHARVVRHGPSPIMHTSCVAFAHSPGAGAIVPARWAGPKERVEPVRERVRGQVHGQGASQKGAMARVGMCVFCGDRFGSLSLLFLSQEKETGEEFVTVRNDVRESHLVVQDLRGGGKYMFRVRPQIDGRWYSWDVSVQSEVILIPAAAPDCPYDVLPSVVEEIEAAELGDTSALDASEDGEAELRARKHGQLVTRWDVTHDRCVCLLWASLFHRPDARATHTHRASYFRGPFALPQCGVAMDQRTRQRRGHFVVPSVRRAGEGVPRRGH